MKKSKPDSQIQLATGAFMHLTIAEIDPTSNTISAVADNDATTEITCSFLKQTGIPPLALQVGDLVLVYIMDAEARRAVIMGKILSAEEAFQAEEIVMTAKEKIEFSVGRCLFSMTSDGEVLTRGEDIVSHAKRQNRVKGASFVMN
jgi:ribosomal protein L14